MPWRVREPTAHPPASPAIDGLLEDGVEALAVSVTVVQDDVVTGWDDGAMGFEEDAVWFSGRACSFRVVASDVLPGRFLLSRQEAVTDGEARHQGLPLRHPSREVWVRVAALAKGKEAKAKDEAALVVGIRRIRAATGGEVASDYPPLTPRPGMAQVPKIAVRAQTVLWALDIALLGLSAFLSFGLHQVAWGMALLIPAIVVNSALALLSGDRRLVAFEGPE